MSAALRRTLIWTTVPLLIVLVCGLDSDLVAAHFAYGQWLANLVMLIYFALMYRSAPPLSPGGAPARSGRDRR